MRVIDTEIMLYRFRNGLNNKEKLLLEIHI